MKQNLIFLALILCTTNTQAQIDFECIPPTNYILTPTNILSYFVRKKDGFETHDVF